MERLSDNAIEIINALHTEKLDYNSEYLPLIEAANRLAAYENTGLMPEEVYGFAMDVAQQFGYRGQKDGRLHIMTGGLSTLEWAFAIIGWEDPHPYPEGECEVEGCHEAATCGTPTDDGYKHVCGRHFAMLQDEVATDKNVGHTIPVNDLYDEDGGDLRKGDAP